MNTNNYVDGFGRRTSAQATKANDDEVIELSSDEDSNLPPPPPPQQQPQQTEQQPESSYNNQSMPSYATNEHQVKTEIMHESVSYGIYHGDGTGDQSSIPDDHNDNYAYDYDDQSDGNEFIENLKTKHHYDEYSRAESGPGLLTEMAANTPDVPSTTDYAAASPMVTSTTAPIAAGSAASAAPSPNPNYSTRQAHSEVIQNITNNLPFNEFAASGPLPQMTPELKAHVETCATMAVTMAIKELTERFVLTPRHQTEYSEINVESNSKQKRKHHHHHKASHESKNSERGHDLRPPKKEKYRCFSSDFELDDDPFGPSTSMPKFSGNFSENIFHL